MPINAVAWCEYVTDESEGYKYRVQVQGIAKRSIKKVRRTFKDWKECGEGTNHKTKQHLLFFTKIFEEKSELKEWAKAVPYQMHEETSRGTLKPLNDIAKGK